MERSDNEKIRTAIMIKSAEEFVRLRTSTIPHDYKRADREPATDEVWFDLIENYSEMREWVASNKSVPSHILSMLARNENQRVRYFTARNLNIDVETLWFLSKDADESVRQRVAVNPNTPVELLRILANDPWEGVVEVVKEKLQKLNENK